MRYLRSNSSPVAVGLLLLMLFAGGEVQAEPAQKEGRDLVVKFLLDGKPAVLQGVCELMTTEGKSAGVETEYLSDRAGPYGCMFREVPPGRYVIVYRPRELAMTIFPSKPACFMKPRRGVVVTPGDAPLTVTVPAALEIIGEGVVPVPVSVTVRGVAEFPGEQAVDGLTFEPRTRPGQVERLSLTGEGTQTLMLFADCEYKVALGTVGPDYVVRRSEVGWATARQLAETGIQFELDPQTGVVELKLHGISDSGQSVPLPGKEIGGCYFVATPVGDRRGKSPIPFQRELQPSGTRPIEFRHIARGLDPGSYVLNMQALGIAPRWRLPKCVPFEIEAGRSDPIHLQITLVPATLRLTGRVCEQGTGDLIPKAKVRLVDVSNDREIPTIFGPVGSFSAEIPAGVSVGMTVAAEGYRPLHRRLTPKMIAALPNLDVHLERYVTLKVRVINERGESVQGASVGALREGSREWQRGPASNDKGYSTVRLRGKGGDTTTVTVSHPSYATALATVGRLQDPIEVTLRKGREYAIRLAASITAPPVSVNALLADGRQHAPQLWIADSEGHVLTSAQVPDSAKEPVTVRLVPGNYSLYYRPSPAEMRRVDCLYAVGSRFFGDVEDLTVVVRQSHFAEQYTFESGKIALAKSQTRSPLMVRVLNLEGAPVKGAQVVLCGSDRQPEVVRYTNALGACAFDSAAFEELPKAPWFLCVAKYPYSVQFRALQETEKEVVTRLVKTQPSTVNLEVDDVGLPQELAGILSSQGIQGGDIIFSPVEEVPVTMWRCRSYKTRKKQWQVRVEPGTYHLFLDADETRYRLGKIALEAGKAATIHVSGQTISVFGATGVRK